MVLRKREKVLASVTAALLAVVGLQYAYSTLTGPYGGLRERRNAVDAEVERKQTRLRNAATAKKELEKRRKQSLPSDPELAQSLYHSWLLKQADNAKFSNKNVTFANSKWPHKQGYCVLRFNVGAKTTLQQLIEFLHGFYRAGHLHRIVSLTITPDQSGKSLNVQMLVEALSLPGATSKDALAQIDSDRTLAAPEVYREKIAARNIFAPYEPPPPATGNTPPTPPAKVSEHTRLTGIATVDGRLQACIIVRTTGKQFRLFEGEEAEIEKVKCKVLRIAKHEAEIEVDSQRRLVLLGKSLTDGEVLSSEEKEPATEQKVPATEQKVPPAEQKVPPAEQKEQPPEQKVPTPVPKQQVPPADEETPASKPKVSPTEQ